jgi:hypothetical protein
MNILVIDAYRRPEGPGTDPNAPVTPKSRVCRMVADALGAEMIWRSPATVAEPILTGFDVLVFNRSLPEIGQNAVWLQANPHARIVHITNDYSVGGAALYAASARPVVTIANHPQQFSTVARMTDAPWHVVNVNALLYEPTRERPAADGDGCVYYGACRPERVEMFRKYLDGYACIAHHLPVYQEFRAAGAVGPFACQVNWSAAGLEPWRSVLYLQDDQIGSTPFLANRFYEALSYHRHTIFAGECRQTIARSGYAVPEAWIVDDPEGIPDAIAHRDDEHLRAWREQATAEQQAVLAQLRATIGG